MKDYAHLDSFLVVTRVKLTGWEVPSGGFLVGVVCCLWELWAPTCVAMQEACLFPGWERLLRVSVWCTAYDEGKDSYGVRTISRSVCHLVGGGFVSTIALHGYADWYSLEVHLARLGGVHLSSCRTMLKTDGPRCTVSMRDWGSFFCLSLRMLACVLVQSRGTLGPLGRSVFFVMQNKFEDGWAALHGVDA